MKTTLLSLLIALIMIPTTYAGHVVGGHLQYKNVSANTFYIEGHVYRDCNGAAFSSSIITVTATCTSTLMTSILTIPHIPHIYAPQTFGGPYSGITSGSVIGQEISDLCDNLLNPSSSITSACRTGSASSYISFKYSGTFTLAPCNSWKLVYPIIPCRNIGTSNMSSSTCPVQQDVLFNSQTYPTNSGVSFYEKSRPIINASIGHNYEYAIGAFDPDGDSLTYTFACPKQASGACMSYTTGYSANQPIPGIKLDSLNGILKFRTTVSAGLLVGIYVNEYDRCSKVLKGKTYREITVISKPSSNQNLPERLSAIENLAGKRVARLDANSISVSERSSFSFTETFIERDTSDTLVLYSNVTSIFPNATLSETRIPGPTGDTVIANIAIPKSGLAPGDYPFVIAASDDNCNSIGNLWSSYRIHITPLNYLTVDGEEAPIAGATVCNGDTIALESHYGDLSTWYALSGDSIQFSGVNQNAWGTTAAGDTNKLIRFLPTQNTTIVCQTRYPYCPGKYQIFWDTLVIKMAKTFHIQTSRDTSLCGIDSAFQLHCIPDSSFAISYQWTGNAPFSNDTLASPTMHFLRKSFLQVKATSADGCVRKDSVKINFHQLLGALEIVACNSICKGSQSPISLIPKRPDPTSCYPKSKVEGQVNSYFSSKNYANATLMHSNDLWLKYPNVLTSSEFSMKNQLLYRRSELVGMGINSRTIITKIGFYITQMSGPQSIQSYSVSLKNTSDSVLTTWKSNLCPVAFKSNLPLHVGWNEIELDTQFVYDGTSNLVVQICQENSGPYSQTAMAYQTTTYNSILGELSANASVCGSQSLSLISSINRPIINIHGLVYAHPSQYKVNWVPKSAVTNDNLFSTTTKNLQKTTFVAHYYDTISGCSDSVSHTISIDTISKIKIKNPGIPCFGSTMTLNADTSSLLSNAGYSWYSLTQNKSIGLGGKINYMPYAVGDRIVLTATNPCCKLTDTILLTAEMKPDMSFPKYGPYCQGQRPDTLVGTSMGIFSGKGVVANIFNPSSDSIKPTWNAPAQVQINYKVQNHCNWDTSFVITVTTKFDTTYIGPSVFCENDASVYPLASVHGGGKWSGTGIVNGNFEPKIAGKGHHNILVDSAGMCGDTGRYVLSVNPSPQLSLSISYEKCTKESLTLDAGNPGSSYLWSNGDTTQKVQFTSAGEFWVVVTSADNCSDSAHFEIVDSEAPCTGIADKELALQNIKLYPNPSDDFITVDFGAQAERGKVDIVDVLGQVVYSQFIENERLVVVSTEKLPSGNYYLQVSNGDTRAYYKFVVKH
ncbi:MAG: T9SS type A sorting domain-containing protein [Flavobacteriales bacterium]|nr:T9SS type A sorting domain-containing protein [Flavobacteriales bacterium]